jgi:PKD repeat protein
MLRCRMAISDTVLCCVLGIATLSACTSSHPAKVDPAGEHSSGQGGTALSRTVPFPQDRLTSVTNYAVLGKDAEQSVNAAIQGNSLVLTAPPKGVAYALFRITPVGAPVNLIVSLGAGTTAAYVGVADYAVQHWHFDGPYATDAFAFLGGDNVSPLGNIYVAVATYDNGTATVDQLALAAQNLPPTAVFTPSLAAGDVPLDVTFDASASGDPDGAITKYEWDFDGDGVFETDGGTNPVIQHTFINGGEYDVSLRVTDNDPEQTVSAAQTITAHGWAIVPVDPTNATGLYTSLRVVDGNPAIAYRNNDTFKVWYARATTATGAKQTDWQRVPGNFGVGDYISLAIISGNPAMSYRDPGDSRLLYARSSTPDGMLATDWQAVTVDTPPLGDTLGQYTSLAEVAGSPAIAYGDPTNVRLKYARATTTTGDSASDWTQIVVVDPINWNSGDLTLLVTDGLPAIAYKRGSGLGYIRSSTPEGSSPADWATALDLVPGSDASGMSMALINGNPAIAFDHGADDSLRYLRSATADGSLAPDWTVPLSIDIIGAEQPSSLAFIGGKPAISYFDTVNGVLKFAASSTVNGDQPLDWSTQTVDPTAIVGQFNSLAEVDGHPAISYFDITNSDLKYAILL